MVQRGEFDVPGAALKVLVQPLLANVCHSSRQQRNIKSTYMQMNPQLCWNAQGT
jgi:hypothetical protein